MDLLQRITTAWLVVLVLAKVLDARPTTGLLLSNWGPWQLFWLTSDFQSRFCIAFTTTLWGKSCVKCRSELLLLFYSKIPMILRFAASSYWSFDSNACKLQRATKQKCNVCNMRFYRKPFLGGLTCQTGPAKKCERPNLKNKCIIMLVVNIAIEDTLGQNPTFYPEIP